MFPHLNCKLALDADAVGVHVHLLDLVGEGQRGLAVVVGVGHPPVAVADLQDHVGRAIDVHLLAEGEGDDDVLARAVGIAALGGCWR